LSEEVLAATEPAINTASHALPNGFPTDLAESIFDGMRKQVAKLAAAR
jgi:serine/threonine-protein kinase HipA